MGFKSAIRKGGGFLNGVTGTIVDTKVETFESKKGEDMLSFRLYIKQDGADVPVDTTLFYGAAEGLVISDDERSISNEDESPVRIGASSGLGIFMTSLLELAPELESRLPDLDAGEPLSLTGLHGVRLEFRQQINEERTKKAGKRKDKKTGREYSQTDLVVERYLGTTNVTGKAAKPVKAASKPNGKVASATSSAGVEELAQQTLVEILNENDGSIPKAKVRMKVFAKFSAKHPQRGQRDEVIATIYNDEFLAGLVEQGVIAYDASDKQQVIAAAA